MRHEEHFPQLYMCLVICLLLVACSSPQPTSTPQPLCEGVEGTCLEIRFDGDSCTHVGPEIVPAGEITLIFHNYASEKAGIDLEILDEGMTWDNMRAHFGRSPANVSQPSWSQDVISAGGLSPGVNRSSHKVLNAGTYISVCWQSNPHLVWLGGELIVE